MKLLHTSLEVIAAVWPFVVILYYAIILTPYRKFKGVTRHIIALIRGRGALVSSPRTLPRVAVIGGGIAGTGAAWTLARAKKKGHYSAIHLYEARSVLGGNAKTHRWDIIKENGGPSVATSKNEKSSSVIDSVRTGLSVLAWPPNYFKTYESLLKELDIPVQKVVPKFFVATETVTSADDDKTVVPPATPQFRQGSPNPKWTVDQRRWDRAISAIRVINDLCSVINALLWAIPSVVLSLALGRLAKSTKDQTTSSCNKNSFPSSPKTPPSFYEVCLWNPLNILTARFVVCRVFGVSGEFWNTVVVPIYSSSFLTTKLDGLPAMILPALDDIISVGLSDPLKTLHTWKDNSGTVFEKMAKEILSDNKEPSFTAGDDEADQNKIILNAKIKSVEWSATDKKWTIAYDSHKEEGAERLYSTIHRERYDYVIFACPATAIAAMTSSYMNTYSGFRSRLFDALLPNITYENERDENFTVGHIHSDEKGLPHGALGEELLKERYTNYIEIAASGGQSVQSPKYGPVATSDSVENIFILGTWVPQAVAAGIRHFGPESTSSPTADNVFKMMVTYNPAPCRKGLFSTTVDGGPSSTLGLVDNTWAHPQLDLPNMLRSSALTMLQGHCNSYYCGNYATPGNGHDLSLLSGIVIADEVSRHSSHAKSEVGSMYPFDNNAVGGALADFHRLRRLMLRKL